MKFSKELFNKHAPSSIKKLLASQLDVLDGMEVIFIDDSRFGEIPCYVIDGEFYYLYPVLKEWCKEQEQLNLF